MSGLFGSGGLLEDWELDPQVRRSALLPVGVKNGNPALSMLFAHNPETSERKPVPPPFGVDERPPSQSEIDFFSCCFISQTELIKHVLPKATQLSFLPTFSPTVLFA